MNPADLPDEALFEEALNCDSPEELAAWLDEHCAGQPELRKRMETLLEAHRGEGMSVDTVRIDLGPEEEVTGTVIGRYKILQKIAEGGMGGVYMAEQFEPVRRKVALKIIKLGMDTKAVIARFEAERQALALMDHPNIAKVLDAGATEMGRPFFVMELVQGVPITEYCDRNKLATDERLKLFIAVCQAIQHAHQKGIIHRDIKPSNVMVTLHDGVPVPKIIDFGVAKATNQSLTEKTLFTNYGQMIGTPAYMSPEQAEMSGLDIDTRSDIYSLGVLLYELLTGAPPFDPKELLSKGYGEIQRIIAEEEPPKPSMFVNTLQVERRTTIARNRSIEPETLDRTLRRDLDWIVMKCLEKDRTRRYETANGLAVDVQRYLATEPVMARPPSKLYELQKSVRRHKVGYAAATAVTLALAIGVVVSTWQAVRATRAEERVRDTLADVRKERDRATDAEDKAKNEAANAWAANQEKESALELARKNESIGTSRLYAAQMNLAAQAWQSQEPARAIDILETLRPGPGETDLRTFEWYYLYELAHANVVKHWRVAPVGWFSSVAWSPDGKWFASAAGGRIQIWDGRTGEFKRLLWSEAPPRSRIAISADGRLLVAASRLKVFVWDLESRKELSRWETQSRDYVDAIAISPDGKRVATGNSKSKSSNGGLIVWDLEGRQLARQPEYSVTADGLAFSTDGKLIAASCDSDSYEDSLVLLEVDSGLEKVAEFPRPSDGGSVSFADDGKTLWAGLTRVDVLSLTSSLEEGIKGTQIAIVPKSDTLMTLENGRTLRLTNAQSHESTWVGSENAEVHSVAVDPTGRFVVSADEDGWITLRDLEKKDFSPKCEQFQFRIGEGEWNSKYVRAVNYSIDGRQLFVGCMPVNILNAETLALEALGPKGEVLAISPRGDLIAVTAGNSQDIWDSRTGDVICNLDVKLDARSNMVGCFSRDGRILATCNPSVVSDIELWDTQTGARQSRIIPSPRTRNPRALTFSPDSKCLTSTDLVGSVSVYNSATGNWICSAETSSRSRINATPTLPPEYSPDGSLLAVGLDGGQIEIFDVDTTSGVLTARRRLDGHDQPVSALAFSPDGRTLASASHDRTVFWDANLGQERMKLDIDAKLFAFSPDGSQLAFVTSDNTVGILQGTTRPSALARSTWRSARSADAPEQLVRAALDDFKDGNPRKAEAALRSAIEKWESPGDGVDKFERLECLMTLELGLSLLNELQRKDAEAVKLRESALELADRYRDLYADSAEGRDQMGKLLVSVQASQASWLAKNGYPDLGAAIKKRADEYRPKSDSD